jgi:hypothetical protein
VALHFPTLAGIMPANRDLNILYEFKSLLQYDQSGEIFEPWEFEELRNLFLQNFKKN